MAVSRGGVSLWVCSHRRQQLVQKWSQGPCQFSCMKVFDWHRACPMSSAPWALAPPNGLRYESRRQPLFSHSVHSASQQRRSSYEEDWAERLGVCVPVPQTESNDMHLSMKLPVCRHRRPAALQPLEAHKDPELFLLVTADSRGQDDLRMETLQSRWTHGREHEEGCVRSLKRTAPMCSSQRHHFEFQADHLLNGDLFKVCQNRGLSEKTDEMLLLSPLLSNHLDSEAEDLSRGDSEEEEKLAVMYERLRIELPSFFMTNHDYTMYSNDVEFINGLMGMKSRGLWVYRLTLSLWRFLSLCYYAEARLDVLKLTKHTEDRTIKARWRIKGLPFHSLLLRFYRKDKSQLYRSFDAFSTFYIGHDGLIHCHKVEKVMPAQPPVLPRVTSLLTGALVALGVQEHRPALNLLPLLLFSFRQRRN